MGDRPGDTGSSDEQDVHPGVSGRPVHLGAVEDQGGGDGHEAEFFEDACSDALDDRYQWVVDTDTAARFPADYASDAACDGGGNEEASEYEQGGVPSRFCELCLSVLAGECPLVGQADLCPGEVAPLPDYDPDGHGENRARN